MARVTSIVFDCTDPPGLARFWAAALDGYAVRPYDDAEIARLGSLGLTPDTDPSVAVDGPGPTLFFQRWPDPSTARSRLHLDVVAGSRGEEVARLCALGARVRNERDGYTVMLDPEGNAFCVEDAR